jgi:pilus assembly protein Flp/PilA
MTFIKNFLKDEDGATAVEYAVLVALIAAAVGAAVTAFDLDGIFTAANTKVKAAQ